MGKLSPEKISELKAQLQVLLDRQKQLEQEETALLASESQSQPQQNAATSKEENSLLRQAGNVVASGAQGAVGLGDIVNSIVNLGIRGGNAALNAVTGRQDEPYQFGSLSGEIERAFTTPSTSNTESFARGAANFLGAMAGYNPLALGKVVGGINSSLGKYSRPMLDKIAHFLKEGNKFNATNIGGAIGGGGLMQIAQDQNPDSTLLPLLAGLGGGLAGGSLPRLSPIVRANKQLQRLGFNPEKYRELQESGFTATLPDVSDSEKVFEKAAKLEQNSASRPIVKEARQKLVNEIQDDLAHSPEKFSHNETSLALEQAAIAEREAVNKKLTTYDTQLDQLEQAAAKEARHNKKPPILVEPYHTKTTLKEMDGGLTGSNLGKELWNDSPKGQIQNLVDKGVREQVNKESQKKLNQALKRSPLQEAVIDETQNAEAQLVNALDAETHNAKKVESLLYHIKHQVKGGLRTRDAKELLRRIDEDVNWNMLGKQNQYELKSIRESLLRDLEHAYDKISPEAGDIFRARNDFYTHHAENFKTPMNSIQLEIKEAPGLPSLKMVEAPPKIPNKRLELAHKHLSPEEALNVSKTLITDLGMKNNKFNVMEFFKNFNSLAPETKDLLIKSMPDNLKKKLGFIGKNNDNMQVSLQSAERLRVPGAYAASDNPLSLPSQIPTTFAGILKNLSKGIIKKVGGNYITKKTAEKYFNSPDLLKDLYGKSQRLSNLNALDRFLLEGSGKSAKRSAQNAILNQIRSSNNKKKQ